MDALAEHYYGLRFELDFRNARGDNFQVFMGKIMSLAYPGDFIQTRPWGRLGDEKCDGYLRSLRKFYQCYAPDEMDKATTIKKMAEDFNGVLPHKAFFKAWVFAHNARDGRLPTWLVLEIENMQLANAEIAIEELGFIELRKITFGLSGSDLIFLFGPPITQQALMSLGFADLKPVLSHLVAQPATTQDESPFPVSAEKLTYNALGSDVEALLKAGMTKSRMVRDYLARTINKEQATKIATSFRDEYQRLKAAGLSPLELFDGLRQFAYGPGLPDGKTEVATLAILAYLFEECDIFENPEAEVT